MAGQQAIEDCPLCGHVLHVGVCGRAEIPELGAIGFCDCGKDKDKKCGEVVEDRPTLAVVYDRTKEKPADASVDGNAL